MQVKREKADVQQTIDNLIKAIEDKEVFIKVAQSRLQERTQRLGCENCQDKPMIGLVGCTDVQKKMFRFWVNTKLEFHNYNVCLRTALQTDRLTPI